MSKKQKPNQDSFEDELLRDFIEDDSFVELQPLAPVFEPPTKNQNDSEPIRMKVTVVRAYVFSSPDLTSRSLTAVSFGNLLTLLDVGEEDNGFLKVRVPLKDASVDGYILKTKVKKI